MLLLTAEVTQEPGDTAQLLPLVEPTGEVG